MFDRLAARQSPENVFWVSRFGKEEASDRGKKEAVAGSPEKPFGCILGWQATPISILGRQTTPVSILGWQTTPIINLMGRGWCRFAGKN